MKDKAFKEKANEHFTDKNGIPKEMAEFQYPGDSVTYLFLCHMSRSGRSRRCLCLCSCLCLRLCLCLCLRLCVMNALNLSSLSVRNDSNLARERRYGRIQRTKWASDDIMEHADHTREYKVWGAH
jgi:hypothetical protein